MLIVGRTRGDKDLENCDLAEDEGKGGSGRAQPREREEDSDEEEPSNEEEGHQASMSSTHKKRTRSPSPDEPANKRQRTGTVLARPAPKLTASLPEAGEVHISPSSACLTIISYPGQRPQCTLSPGQRSLTVTVLPPHLSDENRQLLWEWLRARGADPIDDTHIPSLVFKLTIVTPKIRFANSENESATKSLITTKEFPFLPGLYFIVVPFTKPQTEEPTLETHVAYE